MIAGGGIAAFELLLALRVRARSRPITLLWPDTRLAPAAMTVAEPFGRGGAQTLSGEQIAHDQQAQLVVDTLLAVNAGARVVVARDRRRLRYDALAVVTRARQPFCGAATFGMRGGVPAACARRGVRAGGAP